MENKNNIHKNQGISLKNADPPLRIYLLEESINSDELYEKKHASRTLDSNLTSKSNSSLSEEDLEKFLPFNNIFNQFMRLSLDKHNRLVSSADFVIGASCSDETWNTNDFYCFNYSDVWPGKSEMGRYVIKTLKSDPYKFEKFVTYTHPVPSDMLIILGKEEEYRRLTKDFEQYRTIAPVIDGVKLPDFQLRK